MEKIYQPSSLGKKGCGLPGSKYEELSEIVLEMLVLEIVSTTIAHHKYWNKEWYDHVSSNVVEDLFTPNKAWQQRGPSPKPLEQKLRTL